MERKGQMIFEFMVAAVLFFGIVLYIMSYLNASMATFSDDLYINSLHSKALSASELLVVSEGNWSGSTPISIGLVSSYPVLNSTRMQYLQSYCSNNYRDTLDKLNIMGAPFYLAGGGKGFDAYLEINETGGASRLSCGQPPGGALFAEVHRVALSDDSPKKVLLVRVLVW